MKISSKALTGRAAEITRQQSELTDSEIQASKLLQSIDKALADHTANAKRLQQITAQREQLVIDLNTPAAELNRLDTETRNCQEAIRASQGVIDGIKRELSVIAGVLAQEQQERHDQAAAANSQLLKDVLHTEDVAKAWSVIRGYWRLSEYSFDGLMEDLKSLDVEPITMPERCTYRGSDALEDINRVVNAGS